MYTWTNITRTVKTHSFVDNGSDPVAYKGRRGDKELTALCSERSRCVLCRFVQPRLMSQPRTGSNASKEQSEQTNNVVLLF